MKRGSRPKFEVEEKVRDIETNLRCEFFVFIFCICLVDIVLLAGLSWVIYVAKAWYAYILCAFLLIVCLSYLAYVCRSAKRLFRSAIHQNCLIIRTAYIDVIIDYKDIYSMKEVDSFYDRLFKKGTKTIQFHLLSGSVIRLHYITEDVDTLMNDIRLQIEQSKSVPNNI